MLPGSVNWVFIVTWLIQAHSAEPNPWFLPMLVLDCLINLHLDIFFGLTPGVCFCLPVPSWLLPSTCLTFPLLHRWVSVLRDPARFPSLPSNTVNVSEDPCPVYMSEMSSTIVLPPCPSMLMTRPFVFSKYPCLSLQSTCPCEI